MSSTQHSFALGIEEFRKDLEEMGRQAPVIMARSLNRALVSGQTAITKAVAADMGLGQRFIKKEIVVDKATRMKPSVALTIAGRRIPLIGFQARGPEPSRGRGRGVSYRLRGSRGRVPEAFIATMRSGHRGVFKRKGSLGRKVHGPRGYVGRGGTARAQGGRLPIMELHGPSMPHVFEKFIPKFRDAAQESLVKNLQSEIRWERAKRAGGQEWLWKQVV